jgi:hypothetical protein
LNNSTKVAIYIVDWQVESKVVFVQVPGASVFVLTLILVELANAICWSEFDLDIAADATAI